jgi:hypothetical protein
MDRHSTYRAVQDGCRAVTASAAKSQSRTKINDHREKGKTATMAGFASHFTTTTTTTNRSDYL